MVNPENTRLLQDERAALDAETQLAKDEQKLWQKLDAAQSDALDKRIQMLTARIGSLESSPEVNASELAKARQLALSGSQADAVAAGPERTSSLQARRAALQARELAMKALAQAVAQLESAKAQRAKELDQAEGILAGIEKNAKAAAEAAQKAAEAARKAAEEAQKAEAAKRAKEEAARKAALAAADDNTKTAPNLAPVVVETRTEPTAAPVKAEKAKSVPAAPATQTGTAKKVSRRRRVKLAPPPRKMEIEVATYGDNTFYAGFDQSLANGGLFVASLETLPPGHELELEIDLEGEKIKTRGKVEFVREDNVANPDCTQGAGIKLLGLSSQAQQSIQSFMQKRPPMFFMNV